MARLSDGVKESWEDETLALFMSYRREAGGPDYEFVGRRERPDRVIRVVGSTEEIGVEITRCVAGMDAAAEQRIVALADALRRELSSWADGGRVDLYGGEFPYCDADAVAQLVAALHAEIEARGSLASFLLSLDRGLWEHGPTVFNISSDADNAGWAIADNHLSARPGRRAASPDDIERMMLQRACDKVRKAPSYGWPGVLVLLVRNPYQAIRPSAAVLAAASRELRQSFGEAWLVNHTEAALDISPPEPRLVSLVGP